MSITRGERGRGRRRVPETAGGDATAPSARGGRSCIHRTPCLPRSGARSTRAASGSRTPSTTRSRTTRSTRVLSTASRRFLSVQRTPVRGSDLARRRAPDPGRLRLPEPELDHGRGDDRRSGPSCLRRAAATTTSTGTSSTGIWREKVQAEIRARGTGGPGLPDVEDEALVTRAAASARPQLLLRLRPSTRELRPHLPVSLRAAEPGLRRLPRAVRACATGVP